MKSIIFDDVIIELGENARENWSLIDNSEGDWTWMHLNSFPSGHISIHTSCPTQDMIRQAKEMCLSGTKYINMKNVKFCMTSFSNLTKGDKIGEVEFKRLRKVIVL